LKVKRKKMDHLEIERYQREEIETKECLNCGIEFKSHIDIPKQYCSNVCYYSTLE